MNIEQMKVADLRPYEENPRKITDEAVDAVAASIREFGFKVPIIVDKNNVIIGQLFDDYVFVFLAFAPFGISAIENPWSAILTVPLVSAIVETVIEAIVTPGSKKICEIIKTE